MNKFSHFCIGDDPMKEVDQVTSDKYFNALQNDVNWDNRCEGVVEVIEILTEMASFDINMVGSDGTIWFTDDVVKEMTDDYN